jgi:NTE family protein
MPIIVRCTKEDRGYMMDQSARSKNGDKIGAICIEGGGVKGAAYVGVIQELEERGKLAECKRFSGASAGSQAAALLAMGLSADAFANEVLETDFSALMDGSKCCCLSSCRCLDAWSLCTKSGAFNGIALKDQLNKIFTRATGIDKITFKQAFDYNGNHLRIPVTNLTKARCEILDYQIFPDMEVAEACRISSSFPLVFKPTLLDGSWYVDGGFLNNLPMAAFEREVKEAGEVVLCLNLANAQDFSEAAEPPANAQGACRTVLCCLFCCEYHCSVFQFASLMAEGLFANAQVHDNSQFPEYVSMVNIFTGDISSMNFNLSEEEKQFLVSEGRIAMVNFYDGKDAALKLWQSSRVVAVQPISAAAAAERAVVSAQGLE